MKGNKSYSRIIITLLQFTLLLLLLSVFYSTAIAEETYSGYLFFHSVDEHGNDRYMHQYKNYFQPDAVFVVDLPTPDNWLHVRSTIWGNIIGTLGHGQRVRINYYENRGEDLRHPYSREGNWVRIWFRGHPAYIHTKFMVPEQYYGNRFNVQPYEAPGDDDQPDANLLIPSDGQSSPRASNTTEPVNQAAAAAGVAASVTLATLFMNIAQRPITGTGAPPVLSVSGGPPVNEQGQVFYQPPWDEGGAYWMNGDEYRRMQDMQAQGKVWSNEYGWQDPSDLANYRGQVQNQRDYMAEEVRDHVAEIRTIRKVEEDTTLNDYDLLRLDNYITRRAPNDEAAELMHEVINKMTIKTDDGKVIGSSEDIAREISHILQQTNQPDLTRLERYSIREEIIDEGRLAGGFRDFTSDYINFNSDSIDILNKLDEAKELVEDYGIDLSDVADRFKYYGYLDKANKLMGTYEGLLAAGYSSKEASIRAFVESGVQLGYGFIIDKNPLLKGADVLAGYSTKVLLGREANVSEALQFVTRTALDLSYEDEIKVFYNVATNKFEMGAGSHIDLSDPKFLKSANQGLADALRKQIELPNLDFETRKYLEEELRNLSGTL